MDNTKNYPKPNINNFTFKMILSYFSALNKPQEKRDPIFSLIYVLSEILSILSSNNIDKNFLSQFLYFNKNNIHNILFDNEERIDLTNNVEKYSLSYLFYLSLLIRDNPDLVFYLYSIEYISKIHNMYRNNNKVYEKIIIAKIILELIENYKNRDDFQYENRNREALQEIEYANRQIIRNNINIFREIDLNLSLEEIEIKKVDELYSDIINSLIKSNKIQIYEFSYNILKQLGLETINITLTIFNKIDYQLNSKEEYINENIIEKVEDLYDAKKINFYYFLLEYILKDSNYIYQIKFLNEIRNNIIKILRKDGNKIFINNFNEVLKKRLVYILTIFSDSKYYEKKYLVQKEEEDYIDLIVPDYTELKEVLQYYKNYLFESKRNDINRIEQIIRNQNENFEQYLPDLDQAKYMNDRYEIINVFFASKNLEKTEENFNKIALNFKSIETAFNDKKCKKLRREDKTILFKYFIDENNKNILLKIFSQDIYDHIQIEANEYLNKEKANKKEDINIIKLKEILKYYKNYLFESKQNDINSLENAIKNEGRGINFDIYLNEYDTAKKMNDSYEIINYLYESKNKDENGPKTESKLKSTLESWNHIEKQIREKKIKKMRKEDKILIFNYFNDENNKDSISKIFSQDIIEYFINDYKAKYLKKEKIKKEKISHDIINNLEEILKYYQGFLFESKKDDIIILEQIIRNEEGDYEKYLADLDSAKKMNDRYEIINFIFEKKSKNVKNEKNFKSSADSWLEIEKAINDKKIKKLRRDDKKILIEYFNNENNKNSLLKIFNQDIYEFFIAQNTKDNKSINKEVKIDYNYDINKLNEVLNYYKNYLFESKINDINLIENAIKNNSELVLYQQYLNDYDIAKKMNERIGIINFLFESKNKNVQKTENELKKAATTWENLERQISEQKTKKMRKEDKNILLNYLKKEENKASLLRLFTKECLDKFINQKSNLSQLKEVLSYYKNFLFESKRNDIMFLENAIINKDEGRETEKYLKDFDCAKKMNDRFNIINYIFNSKYAGNGKTEENFKKSVSAWDNYEKIIQDKKIKKLRKEDKQLLFIYFNDNNNKE